MDVGSPRKQRFGKHLVFYREGVDGLSGMMSIINRALGPKVVFNHSSRRVLGIQIKWGNGQLTIFNIYAPNSAKLQFKLWKDLTDLEVEGDWCIIGDFKMVEEQRDCRRASTILFGSKKSKWKTLVIKWALKDLGEAVSRGNDPKFTYASLQYVGSAARLDRCYCSHEADWVPNLVSVSVDKDQALLDHFPLTISLSTNCLESLMPAGDRRLLVTSSHLLKYPGFRPLLNVLLVVF